MFTRETEFIEAESWVPNGWTTQKLGQIIESVKGRNPIFLVEEQLEGYLPYLSTGYLRSNEKTKFTEPYVGSTLVEDGDLILLWDGSNAGEFFSGKKGILSSTMAKLELKNKAISQRYFFYLLKSKETFLQSQTRGTGIPHVDRAVFESLSVSLAPIPEQHKIAEVLSCVDLAIQKTDEVVAKTEHLKKGLVQKLLTEGIGHKEFKDTEIGKMPMEWQFLKLEQVLSDIRYGTSVKSNINGQGVPVLGIPNVIGGEIDDSDLRHVMLTENELESLALKQGDILLVRTNANPDYIGRCALFDKANGICVYASYLIMIRPNKEKVVPEYLVRFLQSERVRKQFLSTARTSAGNYNINIKGIESIAICLPERLEQQRIAEVLSSVDTKLEFERKQKTKLKRIKQGLMDLLLTGKVRVKVD